MRLSVVLGNWLYWGLYGKIPCLSKKLCGYRIKNCVALKSFKIPSMIIADDYYYRDSWRVSYKYLEAVIGRLFISNSVVLISGQFQPHGTCTYFAQSHCNVPHTLLRETSLAPLQSQVWAVPGNVLNVITQIPEVVWNGRNKQSIFIMLCWGCLGYHFC